MDFTLAGGLAGMFLVALGVYLWTSRRAQDWVMPQVRDYVGREAELGLADLEQVLELEALLRDG